MNKKEIPGLIAGVTTGAAVYGLEGAAGYVVLEMSKGGLQSPDQLASTVSAIIILAIAFLGIHDLVTNRGNAIKALITSGYKAGKYIQNEFDSI